MSEGLSHDLWLPLTVELHPPLHSRGEGDSRHSHSSFFVLRTPLLPFDELERLGEGLEAPRFREDLSGLEAAVSRDRERQRERLRSIVARPAVREALFLASRDLWSALEDWERNPETPRGRKLEQALVRYVARMAGRATPFGLFAGHSVGHIGDHTRLAVEPAEGKGRSSHLDWGYLDALVSAITAQPEVRERLTFRPNPTLHRLAGRLRYAEARRDDLAVSHELTEVEPTAHLDMALERAADAATVGDVAEALVSADVPREDAEVYVEELIEAQVLLADLELPITGQEPLAFVLDHLRDRPGVAPRVPALSEVRDQLTALDADGLGCNPGRYLAIGRTLEGLPARVEPERLVHVDMVEPSPDAVLGERVVDELVRAAELLQRLTPSMTTALDRFRDRFWSRYNRGEVALMEALDDEAGVGFPEDGRDAAVGAGILAGLDFPKADDTEMQWSGRERLLLDMLMEVTADGVRTLKLTDRDVSRLEIESPRPLPDALFVSAVLAREASSYPEGGRLRVLVKGAVGPSGARLLGRFLHGDSALRRRVEEHLRSEEALVPDALFAEIASVPGGGSGNVVSRPLLRCYEIPYLGRSGAPESHQLPVSDLLLSVRPTAWDLAGELLLRSRRLGKRIIPRLTSAHNYHSYGAPLYQFLCQLQDQNVANTLAWSWGPLATARFLPRVEVGSLTLSLARWRLSKDELRGLARDGESARLRTVWRLREERGLPRRIALAEEDNVLPFDLDDVLSVESFVSLVKDRDEVELVELWPDPSELLAAGPEGRFVHELLVPLVRRAPARAEGTGKARREVASEARRTFPPGSEWVSAKLYVGAMATDEMLTDEVAPLAEALIASGEVDRWFFIRYADPDLHLRLRFRCCHPGAEWSVAKTVGQRLGELVEHDGARSLVLDSYEREIERYGGPDAIELAEGIFHADSETVVELLAIVEDADHGDEERWRLAVAGASMLMRDLGLDQQASIRMLEHQRRLFGRQYPPDPEFGRRLGKRLREYRPMLEPLVNPDGEVPDDIRPGIDLLRSRSARLRPLVSRLDALEAGERILDVPRVDMAASYVHMYMNRLLQAAHWAHEFVIYDFLLRMLRSGAARAAAAERRAEA